VGGEGWPTIMMAAAAVGRCAVTREGVHVGGSRATGSHYALIVVRSIRPDSEVGVGLDWD